MDRAAVEGVLREAEEVAKAVSEPFRASAFELAARWLAGGEVPDGQAGSGVDDADSATPESLSYMPGSVNEVLALVSGRSHQDRFEVILLHALVRQDRDSLSVDEILSAYSSSRLPRPANPSDVVAKCVRRGHIMEGDAGDGQRGWRLTMTTGEPYAEQLVRDAIGGQE